MCPGNFCSVQAATVVVITVVAAVVRVHVFVRHQRLVGVVHGTNMRWDLPRRRIQLALFEVIISVRVKVVKQVRIAVLRLAGRYVSVAK